MSKKEKAKKVVRKAVEGTGKPIAVCVGIACVTDGSLVGCACATAAGYVIGKANNLRK
jgi:hypothetical protein